MGQGVIRGGVFVHRVPQGSQGGAVRPGGVLAVPRRSQHAARYKGQGADAIGEILVVEIHAAIAGGRGVQVLRLLQQGDLLDHAVVGAAVGAHLAGAPVLLGQCVDDALHIFAVPRAEEAIVHPEGCPHAPDFHKSHRIPCLQETEHCLFVPFKHPPGGVARLQQQGDFPLDIRPVQVYRQPGSITARQIPGSSCVVHGRILLPMLQPASKSPAVHFSFLRSQTTGFPQARTICRKASMCSSVGTWPGKGSSPSCCRLPSPKLW